MDSELMRLSQSLIEREAEIGKLKREIHKLRSVLERSNLRRIPSICSQPSLPGLAGFSGFLGGLIKKCGVSGESWGDGLQSLSNTGERHVKDFRTRQLLRSAIRDNSFLRHLDLEQMKDLVDFMFPLNYEPNETIIREGEAGSHLYVSGEGELEVFQEGVSLGSLGPGKAFGELALLYNCKRTATVQAVTHCRVWGLERRVFQQVMVKVGMRKMEDRLTFLKSVPLLRDLEPLLLSRIADRLSMVHFPTGAVIIKQGAVGDSFYIISQGRVEVRSATKGSEGSGAVLRHLGHGDYFGERALLKEERRTASVIALSPGVTCLTLDRDSFLQLIGTLGHFREKSLDLPENESELQQETRFPRQIDEVGEKDDEKCLNNRISNLTLDDLEVVTTLGVGGFGRVELVQVGGEPNLVFALKCLPKAQILATQQKEHVMAEKSIMATAKSPFIVRLYKTLKDSKCVYLLMEACLGGEVWTLLREKSRFDEEEARFTVGCVLLALEYLHAKNVIYRDLKPENLMLANNGYVKLVDFGFSKVVPSGERTWTFCGTPEYVAPETILKRGHDRAVDFWALGVLLFELLSGLPPWGPMSLDVASGGNTNEVDPLETYNQILKGIECVRFPKELNRGSVSLIRRLCRQCPGERLGAQNGVREVFGQRWFGGFDWEALRECRLMAPIQPRLKGPQDTSHFDKFDIEVGDMPDDNSGWDTGF